MTIAVTMSSHIVTALGATAGGVLLLAALFGVMRLARAVDRWQNKPLGGKFMRAYKRALREREQQ